MSQGKETHELRFTLAELELIASALELAAGRNPPRPDPQLTRLAECCARIWTALRELG